MLFWHGMNTIDLHIPWWMKQFIHLHGNKFSFSSVIIDDGSEVTWATEYDGIWTLCVVDMIETCHVIHVTLGKTLQEETTKLVGYKQ